VIAIIIILPHIFVRSISRRCLDQTLWNLVGISYAMWSCAVKDWFFQNGCRFHGNGQNAKKLKNTQMIIADSNFFGLSRSTRCGCCSYQVSSISVWRVTCYDHLCVFQFFSILAVSMETLLFLLRFLLLLHHPDCCRVMYCYSTFLFHYYSYSYSYSSTQFCPLDFSEMPWSNFGNRGTKIMGWGDVRQYVSQTSLGGHNKYTK
jgi:hypothetical protein